MRREQVYADKAARRAAKAETKVAKAEAKLEARKAKREAAGRSLCDGVAATNLRSSLQLDPRRLGL